MCQHIFFHTTGYNNNSKGKGEEYWKRQLRDKENFKKRNIQQKDNSWKRQSWGKGQPVQINSNTKKAAPKKETNETTKNNTSMNRNDSAVKNDTKR